MQQSLKNHLKLKFLQKRKPSNFSESNSNVSLNNKQFGNFGEDFASKFITDKGYKIICRNFRCKFAEIDIIAIDNDTLVFVEVKTRMNNAKGNPEEAVTRHKIQKILQAANFFIRENNGLPKKMRIDVVAVTKVENKYSAKLMKII